MRLNALLRSLNDRHTLENRRNISTALLFYLILVSRRKEREREERRKNSRRDNPSNRERRSRRCAVAKEEEKGRRRKKIFESDIQLRCKFFAEASRILVHPCGTAVRCIRSGRAGLRRLVTLENTICVTWKTVRLEVDS